MKKISLFLSVLFVLFTFNIPSYAYENSVEDKASLFATDEVEEIMRKSEEFSDITGYSLSIVTTDDAMDKTSEEYADDYLDDLIDNKGWSEDSMLFLIDMDNRTVYISTTGDAQYSYSDYLIETIIDCGYSYLTDGDYSYAVISMIDAAVNEFPWGDNSDNQIDHNDDFYGYDEYNPDYDNYDGGKSFDLSDILIYIAVGLASGLIAVFAVKSRYKNFGKGEEFDEDDMSLKLTGSTDTVISRNVVTTRIPKNNNHGGKTGGSSHTTVHRSSSGRSHGGGGRRF